VSGPGLKERFDVYNPGTQEADVELKPTLDQGSADAFTVTVPQGDRVSLEIDGQQRIPPGIGQAWVVRSTNGAPVVAERIIQAASASGHTGVGDTLGTPRLATGWVFGAGSAGSGADEWLVLFDPGTAPAQVTVVASGMGKPQSLPPVTLSPGSRQLVHIGATYPEGIVVLHVASSAPIAAERAQFITAGPGLSDSIGIIGTEATHG
jgi:hypothetical protein